MKLYVTCSSCHNDILLDKTADTKQEFERNFGDTVEVTCPHCGFLNSTHVNSTFAKTDYNGIGLSILVSIGISILLTVLFGGVVLLLLAVPGLFYFGRQTKINAYNRGMVPRR